MNVQKEERGKRGPERGPDDFIGEIECVQKKIRIYRKEGEPTTVVCYGRKDEASSLLERDAKKGKLLVD
jgi:hypothetical protein